MTEAVPTAVALVESKSLDGSLDVTVIVRPPVGAAVASCGVVAQELLYPRGTTVPVPEA